MKPNRLIFACRRCCLQLSLPWILLFSLGQSHGSELQGYTEPIRSIEVASDETGTVSEVLVRQGQAVEKDQPLVRLNSQIHQAQVEIARQQMNSQGRIQSALAEVELTKQRLEKIQSLRTTGHARQAEYDRALKEQKVAEANLRGVQDEMETRRLEFERLVTQIDRRIIRAPVAGIVTELHRQPGEYVAPNKPDVITLVQLDTLLANFSLIAHQAGQLTLGQRVKLQFTESGQIAFGVVDYLSPVTDAESGTVLVKIAIDNADGALRSGARCTIRLKD